MSEDNVPHNKSRCPHEEDWYCKLLDKPCHPGISGCILFGQSLMDALIAFEQKEKVIKSDDNSS